MTATITPERPDSPDACGLISELDAYFEPLYPPECRHGYSIEKLLNDEVAFFVVRVDGQPAGCGGVKLYGTEYGELKRMYVRPKFRGLGLARRLLKHLEKLARTRGAGLLRLETGIFQPEAIGLYESMGFKRIPPFGEYQADPLGLFFEKKI